MTTKKSPTKVKVSIKVQQELFCKYYVQEGETFGNATLAYANAYGRDTSTEESKHYCAVAGSRLMTNDDILKSIRELLNEKLDEKTVNSQLSWLILQNKDLSAKIAAIREYNRYYDRISRRWKGMYDGDLDELTDEELNELLHSFDP